MQLFFYGLAFRPHINDENGHQKRNFSKTLSKVELFENAVFLFSCGLKKVWKQNFSKTLTSHLRSQATLQREISNMVDNRVTAASLLLVLISSLVVCFQLYIALLNIQADYTRRRRNITRLLSISSTKTSLKRLGRSPRPRRFWVRPGRTSAWWNNFVGQVVIPEESDLLLSADFYLRMLCHGS